MALHPVSTMGQDSINPSNSDFPFYIFVIGAPAAGKGTLCKKMAEEPDFLHVSLGDYLRKFVAEDGTSELAKAIKPYIESETLLPNDLLTPILDKVIVDANAVKPACVLLDGFPRTASQIHCWKGPEPRLVLFFDCPLATARKRFGRRGRGGHDEQKLIEIFSKRFCQFSEENEQTLENYALRDEVGEVIKYEQGYYQIFTEQLNLSKIVRIDTKGKTSQSWWMLYEELEQSLHWKIIKGEIEAHFGTVIGKKLAAWFSDCDSTSNEESDDLVDDGKDEGIHQDEHGVGEDDIESGDESDENQEGGMKLEAYH